MADKHTNLRYVKSKSMDTIVEWVNSLPFKIEIKSIFPQGPMFFLTFTLPDNGPILPLGENLDE